MPSEPSDWTIFVVNDDCPDYTWGFTEEQTRQAMADLVAAHLDEMTRTDGDAPEHRDHYTMAVAQEALCFLERYPERKEELVRRVREGRLCLSPFFCNTLWGLQSAEGAIRGLYPARRLEREWGVRFEVAEHIELPSLPWGMATLLAGCGVRWLSIPFLDYDSTFSKLENPPLFLHEGPDGSQVRVILDRWASLKGNYTQGAKLLRDPKQIADEWLPHYRELGAHYPWRVLLASGTHGDLSPESGAQVRGFSERIKAYNEAPGEHPKLVNATLAQFCAAVEAAGRDLPVVRGDFGHSWELWPVSLAAQVAEWREFEREYFPAEALSTIVCLLRPELCGRIHDWLADVEWPWLMLSDHAWNGANDANRRHNAELRQDWSGLVGDPEDLEMGAWSVLDEQDTCDTSARVHDLVLFNGLSATRSQVMIISAKAAGVADGERPLPLQVVPDPQCMRNPEAYFVSPEVPGFGFRSLRVTAEAADFPKDRTRATDSELDSPFYHLRTDPRTGRIHSLIYKPADRELVVPDTGRSLGQTVSTRGEERPAARTYALAQGPVLARLEITAEFGDTVATTQITVYADLDRVDFDQSISKPATTEQERLCHVFPVLTEESVLRIETPAAVIRPYPQPRGDLLPGADASRLAVQGFVDVERPDGVGVTLAPLDPFALRLDLDPLTFEALGNDQNSREVTRDQAGTTVFRFRYSLRGYQGGYDQARAVAWSRSVAAPLLLSSPRLSALPEPPVTIDPSRAIATCLKPADDPEEGGIILRLWETAGRSGPLVMPVRGIRRVVRTDLLERDLEELPIRNGQVEIGLAAFGMAGVRLVP